MTNWLPFLSVIDIFFDGHCPLCTRTMRRLKQLDWFGKLRPVDFHNEEQRRRYAPEIAFAELDKVIHMRFPNGKTMKGFSAFRELAWRLPPLWLIAPFLYLPGARSIGDRVYARVAETRRKCTGERHSACQYAEGAL